MGQPASHPRKIANAYTKGRRVICRAYAKDEWYHVFITNVDESSGTLTVLFDDKEVDCEVINMAVMALI